MTSSTNNWSLFGLDLTRVHRSLALGCKQLLYERDAWVLRRFDPPVLVFHDGQELVYRADERVEETSSTATDPAFHAVALSEDAFLLKTFNFPASVEEELDVAMSLEVDLSSPFGEQETRAGWRVTARHERTIQVSLAITSQSSIESALAEYSSSSYGSGMQTAEVWALVGGGVPIAFPEYENRYRRAAYHQSIASAVGTVVAVWLSLMVALTVLAGASAIRADSLIRAHEQISLEAKSAAGQTELLRVARSRLGLIEAELLERPNYQYWINHIAASAPDTVYLDRLNFDGTRVTANGYSNDASIYLRMLTENPEYSNVTALSAFNRDRNTGLERFSIEWTLMPSAVAIDRNDPPEASVSAEENAEQDT